MKEDGALDHQGYFELVVWLDHQACFYRRNRMNKELSVVEAVRSLLSKKVDATSRRRKGWTEK